MWVIKMSKSLLLSLLLLPIVTQGSEVDCLARTMWAEASNQSVLGVSAIGHAAINRSKRSGLTLCKLKGVASKQLPSKMRPYYLALAKAVLTNKSVIDSADSWNTGSKPNHKPLKPTQQIGKHVFYTMAGL